MRIICLISDRFVQFNFPNRQIMMQDVNFKLRLKMKWLQKRFTKNKYSSFFFVLLFSWCDFVVSMINFYFFRNNLLEYMIMICLFILKRWIKKIRCEFKRNQVQIQIENKKRFHWEQEKRKNKKEDGELAQLVERIVCIDKARGSKPRFSNIFPFSFCFQ